MTRLELSPSRLLGGGRLSLRPRGQGGSVLPLVLAATLVGGLIVAALVSLVFTNIRSTHAYRGRTHTVQRANDAVNLAVAGIRSDPTRGLDGSTYTLTYDGFDVTCLGDSGSGAIGTNTVADRRVSCAASEGGTTKVSVRIRFVDEGGNNTGAEVEIIDRIVYG